MLRILLAFAGFALCVIGCLGTIVVFAQGGTFGEGLPSFGAVVAGALLVGIARIGAGR